MLREVRSVCALFMYANLFFMLFPTVEVAYSSEDSISLKISFSIRDCKSITIEQEPAWQCEETFLTNELVELQLMENGGYCSKFDSSELKQVQEFTFLEHWLENSPNADLGCIYGIYRPKSEIGTFLPLALLQKNTDGTLEFRLSLARSHKNDTAVTFSETKFKSIVGFQEMEGIRLVGPDIVRSRDTAVYPVFKLFPN